MIYNNILILNSEMTTKVRNEDQKNLNLNFIKIIAWNIPKLIENSSTCMHNLTEYENYRFIQIQSNIIECKESKCIFNALAFMFYRNLSKLHVLFRYYYRISFWVWGYQISKPIKGYYHEIVSSYKRTANSWVKVLEEKKTEKCWM